MNCKDSAPYIAWQIIDRMDIIIDSHLTHHIWPAFYEISMMSFIIYNEKILFFCRQLRDIVKLLIGHLWHNSEVRRFIIYIDLTNTSG